MMCFKVVENAMIHDGTLNNELISYNLNYQGERERERRIHHIFYIQK